MRVLLIASVCLLVLGISECLTPKQEEKVRQLHKECAAETGVDEETTLKATAGELDDSNPALKQHIFCMSKKMGFQNEAGEIQMDKLREEIGSVYQDDVKVESVVTNCVKEEATPEDTAFEFAKCMMMMRKDLI